MLTMRLKVMSERQSSPMISHGLRQRGVLASATHHHLPHWPTFTPSPQHAMTGQHQRVEAKMDEGPPLALLLTGTPCGWRNIAGPLGHLRQPLRAPKHPSHFQLLAPAALSSCAAIREANSVTQVTLIPPILYSQPGSHTANQPSRPASEPSGFRTKNISCPPVVVNHKAKKSQAH